MIDFEIDPEVRDIAFDYDPMLIDALVKLYHQKPQSLSWESYHDGLQAGIRYALLATKIKITGINA